MIPYLREETEKHHTLSGSAYLSSPYMRVTPIPREQIIANAALDEICKIVNLNFHFAQF